MPFDLVGNVVYESLLRPLAEAAGYRVERADTTLNQRAIMTDVVRGLQAAALVIADLTGRNANVFYELGLAHVLGRPTLLLAQSTRDIPFDLAAYRAVIYSVEFTDGAIAFGASRAELEPILLAAQRGEVEFSNPYQDFGEQEPADRTEAEVEGVLDTIVRFITLDVPAATDAIGRIGPEIERATREQEAAVAAHSAGEGDDSLRVALELAADLAGVWTASTDRLEPIVDGDLIPSVLAIEKDVVGVVRAARLNPAMDISEFLASLDGMAESSTDFATTVSMTARLIRENSNWASSLLVPGERMAALYERIGANSERIAGLARTSRATLGLDPPA